jgi:hypothetical protein
VDVQKVKVCSGPFHDRPTELPVTDQYWYFHKTGKKIGKPIARCKACVNWHRLKNPTGNQGTIEIKKVMPLFLEARNRVGHVELARRMEVSQTTLNEIFAGMTTKVQKRTAHKLIVVLHDLRKQGIMRHKKSIFHGAEVRGRKERKVQKPHEQYGPVYPTLENEYRASEAKRKQEARQSNPEMRERENVARRARYKIQKEREKRLEDLTGY